MVFHFVMIIIVMVSESEYLVPWFAIFRNDYDYYAITVMAGGGGAESVWDGSGGGREGF